MDSSLFEGVDEAEKAQFIGNFFHFVKCKFADCNLVQTGAKINMSNPSGPTMTKIENERDYRSWASGKGNHVPAHNDADSSYVQTNSTISNPTGKEMTKIENERNYRSWASGKGDHVPAHNQEDEAYLQTKESKEKILTNTQHEVMADLKKQDQKELVKPTMLAENKGDVEPANVQLAKK